MVVVIGVTTAEQSSFNDAVAYSPGAAYYITAAWDEEDVYSNRVPSEIAVGDGSVFTPDIFGNEVEYINQPLRSNTRYTIFTLYDIRNEANPTEVRELLMWPELHYI